jgi:hypothetical protein
MADYEIVRPELIEVMENEALEGISSGKLSRREAMNQLLVVDCLKSNWTMDDFFREFAKSEMVDPWKIKKQWDCAVTTKQVEMMFESKKELLN